MLDRLVPVNLFQSVSEFGRTSASADANQQSVFASTSGSEYSKYSEPKKLSHYHCTPHHCTHHVGPTPPASIKFNEVFQKINRLLENDDPDYLFAYLDRAEIFKTIKSFGSDERKNLARLLYKDASYSHAHSAFGTNAGYHLAIQPTADQYMVATICSLLETEGCQKSKKWLVRRADYHNHSRHVAYLKNEKASHVPQHFVEGFTNLTVSPESRKYFAIHAGRASKNIAIPCRVCFVHTTDEKAHAQLFHPYGLARVRRNEAPTRLAFSEQFLQVLDNSRLSETIKERLFPPVLYRLFNKVGCNYAALSHSAQLLPEAFLSDELRLNLDQSSKDYIALIKTYVAKRTPDNAEVITDCMKALVNCATNVPALAQIGAEIKAILQQRQVAIPQGTVAQRFLVKKFPMPISLAHANDRLSDTRASLLALNIAAQPTQWYLAGRGGGEDFFSRTAMRDIVRLAMDAVSARNGSDVRPGSAPVFIGHVPSEIADGIAAKHGFLDCIYGGNILHGKYSHALAITCLAFQVPLTQQVLGAIINHSLWGKIFDQNPHGAVDAERESSNLPFIKLNRTKSLMFNNSPYKLHALLTTGQLSASLEEIAIVIAHSCEPDHLLDRLACRMGISEPLTLDKLAQLTDDIRVLEMVLATKHLNSMEQIKRAQGSHCEKLYDPGVIRSYLDDGTPSIGNFPNSDGELERKKAKKYLAKHCQVLGIQLADDSDARSSARTIKIATEADIDKCNVFVVYQPIAQSKQA